MTNFTIILFLSVNKIIVDKNNFLNAMPDDNSTFSTSRFTRFSKQRSIKFANGTSLQRGRIRPTIALTKIKLLISFAIFLSKTYYSC